MSDLAATGCGCSNNNGCNSIIWIILLLCLCGGNGFGGGGCNDGCGDNSCFLIIILLFCCGGLGNNGCGNSFC
ncbi:chorion class high-cysteine HCB protein 13 [Candidatus Galacturonibacter soehngenii]|uniref:Chorion class high-cysteine HCB protein 13 n=1 Tax=Candidatus Galacturonatibacter soehngenii TaxID=2307010 RepID=A0A7V7UC77_9FIRM|nr:chorion class high-cysteine HCB protein 13 [Candidatus Galacturonibacter soehngenii]KAB1439415.1 chorion class high-cysteine HCB protein 13 [Candidatus Galacturonibacter soehngenii]MBA4687278.1 chorion class high-cysteine HCB protein 13 [Candidatus Galacturonibacter soehngenii]